MLPSPAAALFGAPSAWGLWLLVALVPVLAGLWWHQSRRAARLQRALKASLEANSTLRHEDDDPSVPGLLSRGRFEALLRKAAREPARETGAEPDAGRGRRGSRRADAAAGDRRAIGIPAEAPAAADCSLVVLFINLDNFRLVNETHGYPVGDQIIRAAAERICAAAGDRPVAARLGVDEFLLLHRGDLVSACALATRLCAELGRDYEVAGHGLVSLGCSIGLAGHPVHGSRSRLIAHAGSAMQAVKRAGGGGHMVFEPQMALDQRLQAELLTDLRQAVARGQFELYYQPKVDARTLKVTAAEALLRWHHPTRGIVSPALFIPMAERSGLIGQIGNWVIEDACRQAAEWRDQGLRMRVAINLSAYQMRQDDLVDRIEGALARHQLRPERFTVEITESVAMEDTQVTQRSFERLRQAGVHVSIDDFGVGQASLSYLRRLPAAELKIDASFVRDVASRDDARAIVDAVVKLSHALGLKVVAEGVETTAQRDALVTLGCDELQGYLFAKPMSAKALCTWAQLDNGTQAHPTSFSDSLFQETRPQDSLA